MYPGFKYPDDLVYKRDVQQVGDPIPQWLFNNISY